MAVSKAPSASISFLTISRLNIHNSGLHAVGYSYPHQCRTPQFRQLHRRPRSKQTRPQAQRVQRWHWQALPLPNLHRWIWRGGGRNWTLWIAICSPRRVVTNRAWQILMSVRLWLFLHRDSSVSCLVCVLPSCVTQPHLCAFFRSRFNVCVVAFVLDYVLAVLEYRMVCCEANCDQSDWLGCSSSVCSSESQTSASRFSCHAPKSS